MLFDPEIGGSGLGNERQIRFVKSAIVTEEEVAANGSAGHSVRLIRQLEKDSKMRSTVMIVQKTNLIGEGNFLASERFLNTIDANIICSIG